MILSFSSLVHGCDDPKFFITLTEGIAGNDIDMSLLSFVLNFANSDPAPSSISSCVFVSVFGSEPFLPSSSPWPCDSWVEGDSLASCSSNNFFSSLIDFKSCSSIPIFDAIEDSTTSRALDEYRSLCKSVCRLKICSLRLAKMPVAEGPSLYGPEYIRG